MNPPAPMLETARLSVRPFVETDFDALVAVRDDEEVRRYIGGARNTVEFTRKRLAHYIDHYAKHGYSMGVVSLKPSPTMIGWSGLQHLDDGPEIEVGYILGREYWGRGLATELAAGWLRYGFTTLGLDRIVAIAVPENLASIRVMQKLGMRFEKHTSHYGLDVAYHAVTRAEFAATPHALHGA